MHCSDPARTGGCMSQKCILLGPKTIWRRGKRMTTMHVRSITLAMTIFSVASVSAQSFPSKSIRWIVPFPAGGTGDMLVRAVSGPMTKSLQQSIVPDFRPGGGMIIGSELALRAPPDGHTLLFTSNGFTMNPAVRSKMPYTVNDFAAVARMATSPFVMVAHPSVPIKSVEDLTKLARARPGDINYATLGPSSAQNVAMLTMTQREKLKLVEVPFPGIAPLMIAAVGGHVAIAVTNLPDAVPYIDAGRLRPLAVTSPQRSPAAPKIPTVSESGVPGYDVQLWMGAVMARAAPREAITRLGIEIVRALEQRDVHAGLAKVGFNPAPLDPDKFDAFIQTELVRNAKIAREANIRID